MIVRRDDRKITKPKGKDYDKYHKKMVDIVDEDHKELEEKVEEKVEEKKPEKVEETKQEEKPKKEKKQKKRIQHRY